MSNWIVLPIILPAIAATLMVLLARRSLPLQRLISFASVLALLPISLILLDAAAAGPEAYRVGNWTSPFGIILVSDRLSSIMLVLTACVSLIALLYAVGGWDERGRYFHVLFQFQLVGINGAFLTGDIFNLFVFFEVMLISSYGLLLHGGGAWRLKAGFQYVAINLIASTLFLVAVGLIYGVTGTLNLAHLSRQVATLDEGDTALLRTGALLLFAVFATKSALVPLHWWLPGAYSSAPAPSAAVFALLTKVGAYSILRFHSVVFGADAAGVSTSLQALVLPAAAITLAVGAIGVLASRSLLELASYSVIASMGTLLIAGSGLQPEQLSAALYYALHSTLVGVALFLLVDILAGGRGAVGDRLVPGNGLPRSALLGGLFLIAAMAAIGLPPLSGFVGKVAILDSVRSDPSAPWTWGVILAGSLIMMAGFVRAGSVVFWQSDGQPETSATSRVKAAPIAVVALTLGLTAALSVMGGDVMALMSSTAAEMATPERYVDAVLPKAVAEGP